ncbi:MAG: twin-arginine translocation signal domain-containing protein [Chloroflexi bacterium]|nr:MAG: twin-arginine translocation signal domain-containing protein [Chloroflexota bacterium]TME19492.1 MAG: twin-arginine translocation signal domain-containing protein [Chloroflexota bacterium]
MSEIERYLDSKLGEDVDRRGFLKLSASAAGLAALAACGGGTVTPGPSGPTGAEFKLGIVLPYSNVYAELGSSITNGIQLYLNKVGNQAGNRKITVFKEDEKVSTDDAVAATKKLVEQTSVDMIAGYVLSPNAVANRDYLTSNKVPTIIANAGANVISRAKKSDFIYRTSFSNWQPTHPMGSYVQDKLGLKNVLLVYANYPAGAETAQSFRETYTGKFAAADVAPPLGYTGDWAVWVSKITAANPDGIYVFLSGTDSVGFLNKANELGALKNIKVTGSGFFVEQDVLGSVGDRAPVGAVSGLHWALTLDTKENKDFVAAYRKAYNKPPDVFAMDGYDTGRVIVDALNAVKGDTKDPTKFLAAIGAVSFKSPRGDFKFDAATHNVINPVYIRELVKDPQLGYTNKVVATVAGVADPGK